LENVHIAFFQIMKVDGGCFQKKLNFFTIVQIIWSHTIAFYASSYCIYRDIKLLMFVFLISILKLTSESELKASVLCHCMCEYICVCDTVCINVMSHRAMYCTPASCEVRSRTSHFYAHSAAPDPCQPIKKQDSSPDALIAGDLTWDFQHSSYSLCVKAHSHQGWKLWWGSKMY